MIIFKKKLTALTARIIVCFHVTHVPSIRYLLERYNLLKFFDVLIKMLQLFIRKIWRLRLVCHRVPVHGGDVPDEHSQHGHRNGLHDGQNWRNRCTPSCKLVAILISSFLDVLTRKICLH